MRTQIADRCRDVVATTLPFPAARFFVSATVLYAILGSFIYILVIESRNPPTILWLTVIALSLAAAYVVFGKSNVDDAVESAQDLTGNESTDGDEKTGD